MLRSNKLAPLDSPQDEPVSKDIPLAVEIGNVVGPVHRGKCLLLGFGFFLFMVMLCLFEKSYLNRSKPFWLQYFYYCSWSVLTLALVFFPTVAFFPTIEKNKTFRGWMLLVLFMTVVVELVSNSMTNARAQEIVEFATADVLVAVIMVWATPLIARACMREDPDPSLMQYLGHAAPFVQVVVGVVKFTNPQLEEAMQVGLILMLFVLGSIIGYMDKKKDVPVRGSFGYLMVLIIGQLIVDSVGSVFLETVRYEMYASKLILVLLVFEVVCAVLRALATSCAKGAFEEDAAVAGFTFLPDVCEALFTLFIAANVVRSWVEVFFVILVWILHAFVLDPSAISAFRHYMGMGRRQNTAHGSLIIPLESMQLSYLSSMHRFIACAIASVVAVLAILAHAVTPGNLCAIGCSRQLSSGPFLLFAAAKCLISLAALHTQRAQLTAASGGLLRVVSEARGHVGRWAMVFFVSSAFACIHGLHFAVLARNRT